MRLGLDAAYRFDQIGFGPLDFNRTAWVRSGAIVSGNRGSWIRWWGSDLDFIKHRPSDRNPVALITYRFAACLSNLGRSDLIQRPRLARTPSRVNFSKETLTSLEINPQSIGHCSLSLEFYSRRPLHFSVFDAQSSDRFN